MIPLAYLREHTDEAISRLRIKNIDAGATIQKILEIDRRRRSLQKNLDDNLAKGNLISKEVGQMFREGKKEEAESLKNQSTRLKEEAAEIESSLTQAEKEMNALLVTLPNTPHPSVPKGRTPEDNEIVKTVGQRPEFSFDPLPHWELAKKYNLIDFELGNKITGAGFPLYINRGARLQRALINYFLDQATAKGYTEYEPPILVNEETAYATGQLPDKEGQMYFVEKDNFYLIPTAEVPLTNIYRNVILKGEDLPVKLTGYTPCFRREAGSYGKDVRGLNRLHQFDKVEIVRIEKPENSYAALEEMREYVGSLLESLGLEYRILKLCGGDMSFTSALTYDFEVYSAAQAKWLEVSSVSNFEFFQANRLMLRYKDAQNKTQILNTLNGSALALPRIVAAILENFQDPGGIVIPEPLRHYTGFSRIE
jgi:seryl-tRNA synthetase